MFLGSISVSVLRDILIISFDRNRCIIHATYYYAGRVVLFHGPFVRAQKATSHGLVR